MDEIWERAVETALDGQTDVASVRTLTLDGAVKCLHGRLPPPSLFEKFPNLQHLSIANIGVSSLEQFPRLQNLQKLILSDNRIAGGLEFLVQAGLESLRDIDLSNNRIQDIDDLRPLAELRLVSLDLYECPVTRVKDYRSRVFGLIKSLKYLDKMDADENERPESDDEDDEEEDEEEEEEDDPGSGEVDGEERGPLRLNNGHNIGQDGVVDVDEDDESDADEEEAEIVRGVNGNGSAAVVVGQENGFHVEPIDGEDDDDDEENDSDEIDDEESEDEEDVVEVHEVEDSDDEEDGVEDDDDEDEDDEDEEEVDNDEGDLGEPESTGRLTSTEGEIDGHEQGEEDGNEDDDGETGEEEIGVEEGDFEDEEDAEDEEEDVGTGYLVQPVVQAEDAVVAGDDEDDDPEVEEEEDGGDEDEDKEAGVLPSSSLQKRKRDGDDDDDGDGGEADKGDTVHHTTKSSKHN